MKKIIFLCALIIGVSSCTKNFNNLNTNPSQFASPDAESILTSVFKTTADRSENNNVTYLWEYSHLITPGGRYNTGDNSLWNDFYLTVLGNLRQLKNIYSKNPSYTNRVAIANIWECYTYAYLVGTYGPIGYSNAGQATPVVLFDDENTVYTSLLDRLKQASDAINLNGDKLTTDIIYSGDLTKWKKFANSLRLRIALRCQRNISAVAIAAIQDEMANESMLLQSDADDPKLPYGTADGSQSPYYVTYIKNNTAAVAPTLTSGPEMSDYVFTYFRSYHDPRLDAYFNKAVTPFSIRDTLTSTTDALHHIVTYTIPHLGAPKASTLLATWNTPGSGYPFAGSTNTINFSTLPGFTQLPLTTTSNVNLLAPDRPFYFMTYAEVCFMKAEAAALGYPGTQTADQYYYAGINANFAFWGLSAAQATAYEAQNGIKWNTAGVGFNYDLGFINTSIPNNNLSRIWIQEWINYFDDGGFDAWCLQRRTQNLLLPPHTNPGTPNLATTLYADLPDRWPYPVIETSVNPIGVADAAKKLGGNDFPSTLLKFAAPYTHPNWPAVHEFADESFVEKWFGTTTQSTAAGLAAAGLKPYVELSTY